MARRRALLVLLLIGCGTAKPAAQAPAAALPPLPRSSIAAVLLHREELALSDEQVTALRDLDEQLAQANAKLEPGPAAPDAGTSGARPRHGGIGGVGRGGRVRGGRGAMGEAPVARSSTPLEQRIEDNDTRAYLQAEQLLTDEQRERAREIAEQYREQLYDRRHPEGPQ